MEIVEGGFKLILLRLLVGQGAPSHPHIRRNAASAIEYTGKVGSL